jgi:hypothetical protein
MERVKFKNIFIGTTSILFYFLNNLLFKKISFQPVKYLFECYFNDMLASIVILAFANFMLFKYSKQITKIKYILLFVFCCGCVWEFVAPLYKPNSVIDLFDFIAYFIGGSIYYIIIQAKSSYSKIHTKQNIS